MRVSSVALASALAIGVTGQVHVSPHLKSVATVESSDRNDMTFTSVQSTDPVENGKDWLQDLKKFATPGGAAAKLFEGLKSPAFKNACGLAGALYGLISGFTSKTADEKYVDAIKQLQSEFDQAMGVILAQMDQLTTDLKLDFFKTFLVPKVSTLHAVVTALTEYTNSSRSETDKNIWLAQVEPMGKRINAWNEAMDCLSGSALWSCPGNALDLILQGGSGESGRTWPRPAVLTAFTAYHYTVLASSATAICTWDHMQFNRTNCVSIDVKKLQTLATVFSKHVTDMKNGFWAEMGANKMPTVLSSIRSLHANGGVNGAAAIVKAATQEIHTYYYANTMGSFFGFSSWSFIVMNSKKSGSGNWEASWFANGWTEETDGYDAIYSFENVPTASYKDSDCRFSNVEDVHGEVECVHNMHGASVWAFRHGRRRYSIWFDAAGSNWDYTNYESGDYRIITPGLKIRASAEEMNGTVSRISGSADSDTEMSAVAFV